MVREWRRLLFDRSGNTDGYQNGYEKWLKDQVWFKHEDEYSMLFEAIYDQPSQRRVYVEECVKNAHPSWGYVYLTNLLRNRFFDVVFTTNFDDLINEACYLYSDGLRPIVAAHDSAIQGIRVTSGRPKIIKLHGDFLYDNIKNTLAELETLETNTKRKLNQFAKEYGLVVLGYSGRDRSVMDTLELLLRDNENYRQGVYWCHRRRDAKSGRLESLLRRDRVYLVEIDGFDEFTAELHRATDLELPKPIAQPFEMARDRARLFVEVDDSLKHHSVIGAHIDEVLEVIDTREPKLPLPVEAVIVSSRGKPGEAIPIWEQAYKEDPTYESIAYQYADALADAGKYEELAKFVPESPLPVSNKTYFLLRAGRNEEVVDLASETLAEPAGIKGISSDDRALARINRAIALKRLERTEELKEDLNFLEQNGDTARANIRAGVAALRRNKKEMLAALKKSLKDTISSKDLRVFPVFEDFRDDPDFRELVRSASEDESGNVRIKLLRRSETDDKNGANGENPA